MWTTWEPGLGSVRLQGPGGRTTTVAARIRTFLPAETLLAQPYFQFQADARGLEPGSAYTYTVSVDGQTLAADPAQNSFRTAGPGPFSFVTFGDSGEASSPQDALFRRMARETGISFVIHAGDLAYQWGTWEELEQFYFATNAGMMCRLPFFSTPGNHEYMTSFAAPYLADMAAPDSGVPEADLGRYYSWDWGDAHFVSLDSNLLGTDAGSRMLNWVDADLAATGKFWKIAFFHHPPYPTGFHRDDPLCALARRDLAPLLERRGVQLVLSGHEHGYERSFPLRGDQAVTAGGSTTYLVTAGGGGALQELGSLPQVAVAIAAWHYLRADVSGAAMSIRAVDGAGSIIDQVTLAPQPVVSVGGIVSVGDYSTLIAPGSLAAIFGVNLGVRPVAAVALPLPVELGGVKVTVGGVAAPLLYVSPGQLNVQIPYEAAAGPARVVVTTPNGSAAADMAIVPVAPTVLAVVRGSALVSATNAARPGEVVVIYATGLGAPVRAVATGQAAPLEALSVVAAVQVWLGASVIQPLYAGLARDSRGWDR